MATPLEEIVRNLICASGPIDIGAYMKICLTHPEYGYYTSRDDVIGVRGDFTTAPEISQLFGEMIGFWVADIWAQMGKPKLALCELGPGKGTLMADAVRILSRIPGFINAAEIHLVEISDRLVTRQAHALHGQHVTWHETVADLPDDLPLIVINNEFFDALPVHQFVHKDSQWYEVVIGQNEGRLARGMRASEFKISSVGPNQDVVEFSPVRDAVARSLYRKVKMQGGVVLTIDYGYEEAPNASTLQAIKGHQKVDILDSPGECDLTALLDFTRLAVLATESGLDVRGPVGQGAFLRALGIESRAQNIIKTIEDTDRHELVHAKERLIGAGQMGTLFKVLCAYHWAQPIRPEGFGI
jgi:NADH dehydrogenase [ubiquinone] 1 alpha subcomplex assembly factor 7